MCPSGQSLTQADVFLRILATLLGWATSQSDACSSRSSSLPLPLFTSGPRYLIRVALSPFARVKMPARRESRAIARRGEARWLGFGAAAQHRRCAAARRHTGKTRAARRRSSQAPGALFQWAAQGAESIDPGRPVATGVARGAKKSSCVCACVRHFPLTGAGQLMALSPSRYPSLP